MSIQSAKLLLSIAGEYGVASELSKRHFNVSITYGNAKAVDIILCGEDANGIPTYKTVEVKTSRNKRIVTSFFQKYGDKTVKHPDYWVIVYIDKDNVSHYYVLTHQEMGEVQMRRNNMNNWGPVKNGVDNIIITNISTFENQWDKIKF